MRANVLRVLGGVLITILALTCLTYLVAWLNLNSSGIARSMIWMDADTEDYKRFPSRPVAAGDTPFTYTTVDGYPDGLPPDIAPGHADLSTMLAASRTTAFIVIARDLIVYERYFNGHGPGSIQTSFSVAKSFNSAMVGAAISEGLIASLDQPITDHIPELLERDQRFDAITIRHLISMSSGLRYEETGMPWGDDARTYYDPDLRRLALESAEIVEAPGQRFHYSNFNPILIGMVLERATGMAVSDYLSETLWKPLGATADATWSLDSESSGFEKMESGINARAIDFAKFGSLYLHCGFWQGEQVLPPTWIDESTERSDHADPSTRYQYGWWTFGDDVLGDYYAAIGNKGQYIFVFPQDELVIVRHGTDRGDINWMETIPAIAREMQIRQMRP